MTAAAPFQPSGPVNRVKFAAGRVTPTVRGTQARPGLPVDDQQDSSIKTARTKEGSCILLLSNCASRELFGNEG